MHGPKRLFARCDAPTRPRFGSVLRDDFMGESDVDVLVAFAPGHTPGFVELHHVEQELSELLEGRQLIDVLKRVVAIDQLIQWRIAGTEQAIDSRFRCGTDHGGTAGIDAESSVDLSRRNAIVCGYCSGSRFTFD